MKSIQCYAYQFPISFTSDTRVGSRPRFLNILQYFKKNRHDTDSGRACLVFNYLL